jgi:hypothetical protein
MKFECLKFVEEKILTPHEARVLEVAGFKLERIGFHGINTDKYDVYVYCYPSKEVSDDRAGTV